MHFSSLIFPSAIGPSSNSMASFFAKLIFLALVSQALAMGAHFDMTTEQGPQESEPLPPTKPKKHHGLYPPSCKPTCPTGYAKWSFIANADSACPETYHLSNLPREVIAPQKGLCDRRVKFVFSKVDKIEALHCFTFRILRFACTAETGKL